MKKLLRKHLRKKQTNRKKLNQQKKLLPKKIQKHQKRKQLLKNQQKIQQRHQQKNQQLKQKLQQQVVLKQTTEDAKFTRQLVQIADRLVKFRLSQTLKNQYTAETATRSTNHQGAALAAAVADVAEAAVDSAVVQEKCTMQHVQSVEKHARFRSNLQVTDRFIAETATRNKQ
jgi:hypothetical protein